MRIFIAGGSGAIGARLISELQKRGDQVVLLSRNASKAQQKFGAQLQYVEGDPTKSGPWQDAVSGCQGVINLVGESLFAKRWSDDFKKQLRDSRLLSTTNIAAAIQQAKDRPSVLVQGTAVGYYGYHGDEEITEASPPGDDFLAKLCVDWENAAKAVEDPSPPTPLPQEGRGEQLPPPLRGRAGEGVAGVRLAIIRTGVVLDPKGGALKMMTMPFKMILFGGPVGSGKQWVPWIHHADEVGILLLALDNPQARGPINATAPNPVTNQQMAKAIGAVLNRPSFMPTPAFALYAGLGQVAELVVKGVRVLPKKAQELGYKFQFPEIAGALRDLLK